MNFALIVGIVALIAGFFFLFKAILKGVIKAVLLTLVIVVLASILLGIFIIYDGYKTADMLTGVPVLLVSDKGNVTGGTLIADVARALTMDELWQYTTTVTTEKKINGTFIIIADSSIVVETLDGLKQLNSTESLLSYYKMGKVKIYPETFTLSIISYLPESIIKTVEGNGT